MSRFRRVISAAVGADAIKSLARTASAPIASAADLARGLIPGRPKTLNFTSDDLADRFAQRFGGLPVALIDEQISISFRSFWTFAFALLFWSVVCIFAGQSASHSPLLVIAASWAFRVMVGFILAGLALQRALANWQFRHRRLGFMEFARGFTRGLDWLPYPPTSLKK